LDETREKLGEVAKDKNKYKQILSGLLTQVFNITFFVYFFVGIIYVEYVGRMFKGV